jgi:hypothetical protein
MQEDMMLLVKVHAVKASEVDKNLQRYLQDVVLIAM